MTKTAWEIEEEKWEAARAALAAAEAAARAGAGAEQQAAQFAEAARGLLKAARAAAARAHEERQALQRLRAELAELSSHEDYLRRAEVEEERERERVVAAAAEPQTLARLHGAMLQLAYFAQRLAERRWRRPLALRDDDGDDADDEWQLRSALDALHVLVQRATHELLEAEGADEAVRASVVAVSGEAVEELERQQQQLNEEMKAATRRLAELQHALDQCRYVDRLMLHTARSGRDLPAAAELRESQSEEALALRSSSPSLLALAAEDERRLGEVWERASGAGRLPPAAAAAQLGEVARALDAALAAARDELAAKSASSRQLREELRLQQHKNEMLLYLDAVEEGEEMTAADSAEAMARMRSTMYELAMYEQRLDELRRAEGVEHADDGDEGDNAWQLQSRLDHLHEHLKVLHRKVSAARGGAAGAEAAAQLAVGGAGAEAAALAAAALRLRAERQRLDHTLEHADFLQRALDACRAHQARRPSPDTRDALSRFQAARTLAWAPPRAPQD